MKKIYLMSIFMGALTYGCSWVLSFIDPMVAAVYAGVMVGVYYWCSSVNMQTLQRWKQMFEEEEQRLEFARAQVLQLQEDIRDLQSQLE